MNDQSPTPTPESDGSATVSENSTRTGIEAADLEAARNLEYEGDREPASDERATVPPSEDPAAREAPEFTMEYKRRQCEGLVEGVLGFAATLLEWRGSPIRLEEHEKDALSESGGKALRHYVEIRDGQKAGDTLEFVGTLGAFMDIKRRELKEAKRRQKEQSDESNE